jgi:uncharacterized Tic20 family protein
MPHADAIEEFPEPEFLEGAPPRPSECTLALVAHLGGVFTSIVIPAYLYMTQRDKSEFVVRHAREALNHQISICFEVFLLYSLGAGVFAAIYSAGVVWHWSLLAALIFTLFITLLVLAFEVYLAIRACQKALKGRDYRYPLTIRLI